MVGGFKIIVGVLAILLSGTLATYSTTVKKTPESHIIEIKQLKFHPAELEVSVGDEVVWVNRDFFVHDVTEAVEKKWTSDSIPRNGKWSMTVTQSVDYFCSIHPMMKGAIIAK